MHSFKELIASLKSNLSIELFEFSIFFISSSVGGLMILGEGDWLTNKNFFLKAGSSLLSLNIVLQTISFSLFNLKLFFCFKNSFSI